MTDAAKTIVYTCPYVPAEWIAAHGLSPHRMIPKPVEEECIIGRLEGLCPYARAFANDAAVAGAGGIVVTTLCDQMRRIHDLLARRANVPTFLLNVPKTWETVSAQRLYLDELKRLGRFLVQLGGRAPSDEGLAKSMTDPVGCAMHTASPDRNGVHGTPYTPIAVVVGPLMQRDRVLFDLIQECGGCVVLDATETGQRGRRRAFDRRRLGKDPIIELADAYFSIPDASRRPNSGLYEWLRRELSLTGARGIIFHHYLWCDTWRAELARLKEWVGLPVLGLDNDGSGEPNVARLRTRIRAFVEVLQ